MDDRRTHIYVLPVTAADPEADKEIKKPRRLTDGDLNYAPPIWSPDGASILTSATRDPESAASWIYQDVLQVPVPAAGAPREAPVPLTRPGFCNHSPRPAPDGSLIAFLREPKAYPGERHADGSSSTGGASEILDYDRGQTFVGQPTAAS
jgi:Tol biopolymer transport system component